MKTDTATITLSDAAYLLRNKLGPMRNWTNFLSDNIRGKQDIAGYILMPVAQKQDSRALRPIYATQDVLDFIEKVLAVVPTAGKTPIKQTILSIDTGRLWRVNKFKFDGSPLVP